jgi:hypothetical protein
MQSEGFVKFCMPADNYSFLYAYNFLFPKERSTILFPAFMLEEHASILSFPKSASLINLPPFFFKSKLAPFAIGIILALNHSSAFNTLQFAHAGLIS